MKRLVLFFICVACSGQDVGKQAEFSVPVEVATVEQKDVPVYIEAIGRVKPLLSAEIRPQVGGKLLAMHVAQGQEVKKGDILFTIDPRPFEAALEKAKGTVLKGEAAFNLSKKKVERYSDLVKLDFVAALNYEEIQADLAATQAQMMVDQAQMDLAVTNLDYCTIESPIDGRVGNCYIDPGNIVSAHDSRALTVVSQIDPAVISFSIAQKDFQKIQKNHSKMVVEVSLPDEKPHKGEVYFIDNHLDPKTGTILLKAKVSNKTKALWPGEFVHVKLFVKTQPKALTVPTSAVQIGQKGPYLYVVDENDKVDMRLVTLGEKMGDFLVVEEGITEGETVVTVGQLNLRSGAKVGYKKT